MRPRRIEPCAVHVEVPLPSIIPEPGRALPVFLRVAMLASMEPSPGREALAPETFRPRFLVRTVVLAADTLWICVFIALLIMNGATRSSFWSAAFFILLFTACSTFYGRLAFTVSEAGLTVRTFADERHFQFEDILRVDVLPGLIGPNYAVRTRLGSLQFSALLAGHQRLCSLIVRNAGLSGRG